MTIPVVITGVVVLSVVITVCTLVLLGFCLWPVIQDFRREKRLKDKHNNRDNSADSSNLKHERL
ncbi:hypothetical protein I4U23_028094 [Adineta vaga]|nr:hypothetical protein I4U23_028094 [Adineta vaga]